jgi:hypothetical protein
MFAHAWKHSIIHVNMTTETNRHGYAHRSYPRGSVLGSRCIRRLLWGGRCGRHQDAAVIGHSGPAYVGDVEQQIKTLIQTLLPTR